MLFEKLNQTHILLYEYCKHFVRELGPQNRDWALELVLPRPKAHSTSYTHSHTWALNLSPDAFEPNLDPGTQNEAISNTPSKPPPPFIPDLDGRVIAWRRPVPSCPAVHLTTSLSNRGRKWESVPMPLPPS